MGTGDGPRIKGSGVQLAPSYPERDTETVRKDEKSLAQVAARLGISEPDLLAANPQIKDPKNLMPGQEIHLPQNEANAKPAAEAPVQTGQPSEKKAGPKLSEFNLSGQIQEMILRGKEIGTHNKDQNTAPSEKREVSSFTSGGQAMVHARRDPNRPRRPRHRDEAASIPAEYAPIGHTWSERAKWRRMSPKERLGTIKAELKSRGYKYDKQSLVRAAQNGELRVVKLFMAADLGRAQKCFLNLVKKGDSKAVETFLRADMKPNDPKLRDGQGRTPLMLAGGNEPGHWDTVNMLIDHGADPKAKDNYGRTVLMHQAETGVLTPKLLEKARDTINQRDDQNRTAIMYAARSHNPSAAENLIAMGAKIDAVDDSKMTALGVAVANDKTKTAKRLMELHADPDGAYADKGEMPLHTAIKGGNRELVEAIMGNPKTHFNMISDGMTALDIAIQREDDGLIDFLKSKGALTASQVVQQLNQHIKIKGYP